MLFKAIFTFLAIGALSVNALTVPIARSPAPKPDSQELEARTLLFSRELQALDELFSREPEDWAEWVGFARDEYLAKRGTCNVKDCPVPHFNPVKNAPAPPPPPPPPFPPPPGPFFSDAPKKPYVTSPLFYGESPRPVNNFGSIDKIVKSKL